VIRNRWLILFVLFLARTAMALQFQTVASTGPFLLDALAIDFASLGLLIGLYMLPGVVIALPGGVLGQRFGTKPVVLVGLATMFIGGVIMGLSSSFQLVAAGRLISGVGAVLFNVMITKMVADWFAGREIVTAMGILVSSWPFGLAIGLIVFSPLGAAYGWRVIMEIGALSSLAALVLVALLYRDPPDMPRNDAAARFSFELSRREWLTVSIAGIVWALSNVGFIVLISFAPALFTQRGFTLAEASGIVSLIGWSLIPSIPLWSMAAERLGRPNLIMHGTFVISAVAIAALPFAGWYVLPLAAIIVFNGAPPGLIMALPAQVLRAEHRATGMGVYYTVYYVAMALLPGGAGWARDLSGSAAAPILFSAAMVLLCTVGLMLFHVAKRTKET
jgi:predicted MFS family arabinose efflux permease